MNRILIATTAVAALAAAGYFLGIRSGPARSAAAAAAATADTAADAADNASSIPPPSAIVEGQQYRLATIPVPPPDPQRIRVQEFFWYGCPHCRRLEPLLAQWRPQLAADVDFERVPDSLGRPDGTVHERAFYVAKMLGIEDKIHQDLMDALVVQGEPLTTPDSLRDFFALKAGIKPGDFTADYGSFAVDADVQRADRLATDYGIRGVPTLVVGGRYVTETGLPGIYDARRSESDMYKIMLQTVDFLVIKVRQDRTHAAAAKTP